MKKREPQSLKSVIMMKALERLTGFGRPLDNIPVRSRHHSSVSNRPSPPSHASRMCSYQPPSPLTPNLPTRTRCITPPPFESKMPQPRLDLQSKSLLLTKLPEDILLLVSRLLGPTFPLSCRFKDTGPFTPDS
jgi:hypothetical protein